VPIYLSRVKADPCPVTTFRKEFKKVHLIVACNVQNGAVKRLITSVFEL
jgi:hypothetical protein